LDELCPPISKIVLIIMGEEWENYGGKLGEKGEK
jgi:hypothetical protein